MYVIRQEVEIQGLHFAEFEERQARFNEFVQSIKGSAARRVLRSDGHPFRYSFLWLWQSFEDADAAARGPVREYLERNPPAAWASPLRPTEAYQQVHEITASGAEGVTPGQVMLVDWTLSGPGAAQAFEASRKEIFALHQQQSQGFLRHRLLRFLGNGNQYLVVNAWTSTEAARAAFQSAQAQALIQKHPASAFSSISPTAQTCTPVPVAVPA